jgi:hypothetical protein
MLRRLTYVEFFGVVLTTVPAGIPHEAGALMWDSISRPFMPRLFFPDKAIIDDTARTNFYTYGLAGSDEGTSISLGWIAEMYIDFGEFGMFAAIFAIGYLYGRIYRFCLQSPHLKGLLGMGAACALFMPVAALENSFTKIFGAIIVQLLIVWLIARFAIPRFCPWIAPFRG